MSDRDEARRRREEARRQRREQEKRGSAAEPDQQSDEPGEPTETDANGGHPTREALMSAATVAAAGAAVGAALGAARALTDRDGAGDDDSNHEDGREGEPEPAAELEPEPDETPEPRIEPQAGAAPEPERDPEPRDHAPVAGATPDETADVVRRAREQLRALHGTEPESISALERTPDGWRATFEVVELERVPDSTDVLASYEVVLDERRNVTRYERIRRYYRAQADHAERG